MNKRYFKIHREGWKFFFISIFLCFIAFFINLFLFLFFLFVSLFMIWFFRDPGRDTSSNKSQIISAADGKICFIGESYPPKETNISIKFLKVSIFMNVFNVHINRSPISGTIENIYYKKGKFFNASLDKASEYNERNSIIISDNKNKIIVVQIAGLIARRILSFVREKDYLKRGERLGLIRFGSRVDIYLPLKYKIKVSLKDKVRAGETVIADI